jgi:hypothetical protein
VESAHDSKELLNLSNLRREERGLYLSLGSSQASHSGLGQEYAIGKLQRTAKLARHSRIGSHAGKKCQQAHGQWDLYNFFMAFL